MSYKKKIETSLLGKESTDISPQVPHHQQSQNQQNMQSKVSNTQFISVRSYRSLLSPFS